MAKTGPEISMVKEGDRITAAGENRVRESVSALLRSNGPNAIFGPWGLLARPAYRSQAGFVGLITASIMQSGQQARWDYSVVQAQIASGGASYEAVSGGVEATAVNRREFAHIAEPAADVAWYVWGVDAHGEDYPAGFAPRPVGGGGTTGAHKVGVAVWVDVERDAGGNLVHLIDVMGSHDGTCEAPE